MMKARKIFRLSALLLGLCLVGCEGSGPPPKPAAAPSPPAPQSSKPPAPAPSAPASAPAPVVAAPEAAPVAQKKEDPNATFQYNPEGRRDPFKSIIVSSVKRAPNEALPPLQRRELSELKLIGVVWGSLGYGAIIQTPDGKGYPVRKGTRVGLNNGVITRISVKEIVVQENYLDIFGERKVREITLELHPQKEGLE